MYEAERETANDLRSSSILGSFRATGYDAGELINELALSLTTPHYSASRPLSLRRRPLHETSKFLDRLGVIVHL